MNPPSFAPTPVIRDRFRALLESPEWATAYHYMHPPKRSLLTKPLLYLLTLRFNRYASSLVNTYALGVDGPATRRAYLRLAETGVPLNLAVIMQNNAIRPGGVPVGPAIVAGAFDDPTLQSADTKSEADDWILKLMVLGLNKPTTKDERIAARALANEDFSFRRRDRVPPSLCAGRDAWLFNIMFIQAFATSDSRIVALVEPGDRGAIAMIPPSVVRALKRATDFGFEKSVPGGLLHRKDGRR